MSRISNALAGPSKPPRPAASPLTVDPYRPLPADIRRRLRPSLTSSNTPSVSELLDLPAEVFNSRLSGRTILLHAPDQSADPPTSFPTTPLKGLNDHSKSLLKGKKRNRGDPAARAAARADAEQAQASQLEAGVVGIRKFKKRTRDAGVVRRGSTISYTSLIPLHHLHSTYMHHLLGLSTSIPTSESTQSKLVKADLTGGILHVTAAKNPSLVGLRGITIEETSSTFRLVCTDDRVRIVPKVNSLFTLHIPLVIDEEPTERGGGSLNVDVMGAAFAYRSYDRAGRKFRYAQGDNGCGWGESWVKTDMADLLTTVEKSTGELTQSATAKRKGRRKAKSRRKDTLAAPR